MKILYSFATVFLFFFSVIISLEAPDLFSAADWFQMFLGFILSVIVVAAWILWFAWSLRLLTQKKS